MEKLDAVDTAGEGLFVGGGAGGVAAEGLGDVAELLDAVDDGALVEGVRFEVAACAAGVAFDIEKANRAAVFLCSRGETGFGDEERAEAVPVAFAGGAGDDVIDGFEDTVERIYVVGPGSWNAGRKILRGSLLPGCLVLRGIGFLVFRSRSGR